ncbi:MAG: transcriptional regulator, Crp/Fnr family [Verrucomicrobiales bacterium]|nr:transcriptional regulator, Crp/Fnr family [Verrucomicrobiales bacterium]
MIPQDSTQYKIWGVDQAVYGPVELATLISWVHDDRVTGDTWLFDLSKESWHKASALPELKAVLKPVSTELDTTLRTSGVSGQVKPGMLRRVKVLAELQDEQLERFASFMVLEPIRQWTELVRHGMAGDTMYLILEGEFRVRLMIGGKETILAQLLAGDCFGEIALFDDGPRSADVVANKDCTVLKISKQSLTRLINDAPDVAAPFLLSMGKTLASRIRADNKKIKDAVALARGGGY